MATFTYHAVDKKGKKQKGQLNTETLSEAKAHIKSNNWQLISIRQLSKKSYQSSHKRQLSSVEMAIFFRQLSSLIEAAIPIDEALMTIKQNADNRKLTNVVGEILEQVLNGHDLSYALEQSSHTFSDHHIQTVGSGEKGSNLALVLDALANDIEKQHKFSAEISSALIYPMVVAVVSLAIVSALLVFVVPEIVGALTQAGQELPALTVMVINISDFLADNYIKLILLILAIILLSRYLLKKPVIRMLLDGFIMRLPMFGKLAINVNAVRFARTLAILHDSNTPIEQALTHSAQVVRLMPMKQAILLATERVKQGSNLYTAFKTHQALPTIFLYMIASGETTANLSKMLNKASENEQYEIEYKITKMLNIFQPLMILITGAMVLVIVLAILSPIFELNSTVL